MEEPEESGLEHITDTVTELVTGIPAPIRKIFLKRSLSYVLLLLMFRLQN